MYNTCQFQYIVSAQFFYYDPVAFYFILTFETGSPCVDEAGLGLVEICLSLIPSSPSARIKGMC